jgi:hypothetical protein
MSLPFFKMIVMVTNDEILKGIPNIVIRGMNQYVAKRSGLILKNIEKLIIIRLEIKIFHDQGLYKGDFK